jgi:hypothetical protein
MTGRWWAVGAWVGVVLATAMLGCRRAEPKPTAKVDEKAVQEYQALWEKKIAIMEETTSILKTVDSGAASRENAKVRLLELLPKQEKIDAELKGYRFKDFNTRLDVESEVAGRLAQRQQLAFKRFQEEIQRINALPGGEDFFQKDLRQVLEAVQRK